MIHSLTDTITLNEQVSIPGFGLGVFQIPDEEVATVVKNGILKGYRLIDAAQIYDNESGTGQGIKEGLAATGLTREELFVTSKVWNNYLTYDETIVAFEKSLALLQLDYLDLYLLHWPGKNAYQESWRALEDLHQDGRALSSWEDQSHRRQQFSEPSFEEIARYSKSQTCVKSSGTTSKISSKRTA